LTTLGDLLLAVIGAEVFHKAATLQASISAGGYDAIAAVANDLLPRLRNDPQLGRFWKNRAEDSIMREKQLLIDFLCASAGGSMYGRDMLLSHRGMGISESDWKVRELRKTLGDYAKPRRFIETVHGRGYRFIAPVIRKAASDSALKTTSVSLGPVPIMVGRASELEQLRGWFAQVREAQRRIVFVTGEPGIGKTTFVRAFLPDGALIGAAIG
jgi:hemoglobin